MSARDDAQLALALVRARRRACPVCHGRLEVLLHRHADGTALADLEACPVPGPCPSCGRLPAVFHSCRQPGRLPGVWDPAQHFDRGGHSREELGQALAQELEEMAAERDGRLCPPTDDGDGCVDDDHDHGRDRDGGGDDHEHDRDHDGDGVVDDDDDGLVEVVL